MASISLAIFHSDLWLINVSGLDQPQAHTHLIYSTDYKVPTASPLKTLVFYMSCFLNCALTDNIKGNFLRVRASSQAKAETYFSSIAHALFQQTFC